MKKRIEFTETGKRITYTFKVGFSDGTEKNFTVKDDGWKVWIDNEEGYVDSLLFHDGRMPDKRESERHLDAWAWERYGEGRTLVTADCGHTVCEECGGHTEIEDTFAHEEADANDFQSSCYCCADCGKPMGH